MPTGNPVGRHCIVVLKDGNTVIDWGNSRYQELLSGEYIQCQEEDISHSILNDELEVLKRAGQVEHYDTVNVYLVSIPEPPRKTIN